LLLSAVLRPRAAALLLPGAVDRYLLRVRRSAAFKALLDEIWLYRAVKCDFMADLTDTGI